MSIISVINKKIKIQRFFVLELLLANERKKQYDNITLKIFRNSHDRFLIIDENEVYHIGASLKDLGKKWFAFSKMSGVSLNVLGRLE